MTIEKGIVAFFVSITIMIIAYLLGKREGYMEGFIAGRKMKKK
jgi:hypothetical protein